MQSNLKAVRVHDIILNDKHERFNELGKYDSIGMISYTELNANTPYILRELPVARTLFYNFTQIPTKQEIVYIVIGPDSEYINDESSHIAYYLPPIGIQNTPIHNAMPSSIAIDSGTLTIEEIEGGATATAEELPFYVDLGKDFKEVKNIRPLKIEEGDISIEGRYGNSIRFGSDGGYTNPITIIRNGQSDNKDKEPFEHT